MQGVVLVMPATTGYGRVELELTRQQSMIRT